MANIAVGVVKRVKAVCAMGKYDAVITQAGIEPGFLAAMSVSTLPIAYPVHSAMHFASLLGEKFCALTTTDAQAMIVRRNAQLYGMNHKLTSVRYVSLSSTGTMALVRKYKKGPERTNAPEVKAFVGAVVDQFVRAIEDEGADSRDHRLAAPAVFPRRSPAWASTPRATRKSISSAHSRPPSKWPGPWST